MKRILLAALTLTLGCQSSENMLKDGNNYAPEVSENRDPVYVAVMLHQIGKIHWYLSEAEKRAGKWNPFNRKREIQSIRLQVKRANDVASDIKSLATLLDSIDSSSRASINRGVESVKKSFNTINSSADDLMNQRSVKNATSSTRSALKAIKVPENLKQKNLKMTNFRGTLMPNGTLITSGGKKMKLDMILPSHRKRHSDVPNTGRKVSVDGFPVDGVVVVSAIRTL